MKKTLQIKNEIVRINAINLINIIPLDELHEVIIRPYKINRSLLQNSLMWVWLGYIAEDLGWTKEDLHDHYKSNPPVIIGHEWSGQVVELGLGIESIKVGDRVTSETTAEICGECRFCATEDYNLCINRKGIATKAPGAFAEYFCIRAGSTHVLPENVDYDAGALILQVKVNNTWTPFIVDDAGDAGWYCSLAVGGDGSWHIAYYDNVAEDLKYARRDGPAGAWETVVVDSDGDTGKHTSIALDAQGRPHISYYDASRTDLKYAVLEAYVPTKKASWGELKELLRDR